MPDSQRLAALVLASNDHEGLPFAVVDKKSAVLIVYRGDGALAGLSPALIGQAVGDHSTPGVGERAQRGALRFGDRTTPAGRFASAPGRNISGEAIVWLDYASAFAIHRLRAGPSHKRRALRLASPYPEDRRASAGCVIVPVAFYDQLVEPLLGRGRGVVYVLPEDRPALEMLQALAERGS